MTKDRNEYYRRWRAENREKINARSRAYKKKLYTEGKLYGREKELTELVVKLKSEPCADCKHSFPTVCMDFDHRPGTEKVGNVGTMFARHWPTETILAEVAKCDLVCANCHRIRTNNRRKRKRAA